MNVINLIKQKMIKTPWSKYYKKEAQKPQHAKTFVVKHVVVPK